MISCSISFPWPPCRYHRPREVSGWLRYIHHALENSQLHARMDWWAQIRATLVTVEPSLSGGAVTMRLVLPAGNCTASRVVDVVKERGDRTQIGKQSLISAMRTISRIIHSLLPTRPSDRARKRTASRFMNALTAWNEWHND